MYISRVRGYSGSIPGFQAMCFGGVGVRVLERRVKYVSTTLMSWAKS